MWWTYALLAAIFAAATAILAKKGVEEVDPDLATAIRTVVILAITWAVVFAKGSVSNVNNLSSRNLVFLALSGIATGFSWLFYFKALQLGRVSQVAPVEKLSIALTLVFAVVFLGEPLNWKTALGTGLILLGVLVLIKT
jgi:bacterial/archaeal transporter family protein